MRTTFATEQALLDYASSQGWDIESYGGANGITFSANNGTIRYHAFRSDRWHLCKQK